MVKVWIGVSRFIGFGGLLLSFLLAEFFLGGGFIIFKPRGWKRSGVMSHPVAVLSLSSPPQPYLSMDEHILNPDTRLCVCVRVLLHLQFATLLFTDVLNELVYNS